MVTIDRATFARNLIRERKKADLSTYGVAKALGVGLTQARRWEQGEQLPSLDSLVALCAAIGCSTDDLLDGAIRLERWEIIEDEGGAA